MMSRLKHAADGHLVLFAYGGAQIARPENTALYLYIKVY